MITRELADFAAANGSEVFDNSTAESQVCTVISVKNGKGTRSGMWTVLVEYGDGSRRYAAPSDLTPTLSLMNQTYAL